MLVGNDVVDLLDPQSQPGAIHPRWDARVFTAFEQATLAEALSAHVTRWKLWAAKESAFKVAKKMHPGLSFFPTSFQVELLDETTCYVNSLGALTAVGDQMPWGTSAVDGPTAFLTFIALYLEEAREEQPAVYDTLRQPAFQDRVRDLWLRTHFFRQWADDNPKLSVEGDRIKEQLYAQQPVLESYLGAELAASHCMP